MCIKSRRKREHGAAGRPNKGRVAVREILTGVSPGTPSLTLTRAVKIKAGLLYRESEEETML